MFTSTMVPSYQVTNEKEEMLEKLDQLFCSYQQLEPKRKVMNIIPSLDSLTKSLYQLYITYPKEVTAYILEATKVVDRLSLFMMEAVRVLDAACNKNIADAFYCKGELHRCKVLQDDKWLSNSTPYFKRAAALGHSKAIQRYEENLKAIDAHNYLQTPYAEKTSAMYHNKGLDLYFELVKAGRYEFAAPMLNVFEASHDEVNIHRLLKYLSQKMPTNSQLSFMVKEHSKDMVWFYGKKVIKTSILAVYLYFVTNWILTKLYFNYKAPWHVLLANLFLYWLPAIYTYRHTRKVFSILIALFEPTERSRANWDTLIDCMLISMIF